MRWGLSRQLDDVLAQVRLVDVYPDRLQLVVELQLLRHHALAFRRDFDPAAAGEVAYDGVGLAGVFGEVHLPPGGGHIVGEQLDVVVQVVEGVDLDAPGLVTPLVPRLGGYFFDGVPARNVEPRPHSVKSPAQLRVQHRRRRRRREFTRLYFWHIV